MHELQNSLELELEAWARLLEEADSRFKFLGGHQPVVSSIDY